MKSLLIMRHAKSSWDNPALSDHERVLNARGLKDAPRMGALLAGQNVVPEAIFSSTAVRAQMTADIVAEACEFTSDIVFDDDLYLAEPSSYLTVLATLDNDVTRAMVIGHNPGLEHLIAMLTGDRVEMPTAALAQVELDIDEWRGIGDSPAGQLAELWRPRELK